MHTWEKKERVELRWPGPKLTRLGSLFSRGSGELLEGMEARDGSALCSCTDCRTSSSHLCALCPALPQIWGSACASSTLSI